MDHLIPQTDPQYYRPLDPPPLTWPSGPYSNSLGHYQHTGDTLVSARDNINLHTDIATRKAPTNTVLVKSNETNKSSCVTAWGVPPVS